jgi:hypothetical protein
LFLLVQRFDPIGSLTGVPTYCWAPSPRISRGATGVVAASRSLIRVSQVVVFVPLAREFIDYQDRLDSLRFVLSLLSGLALISG